MELGNRCTKSSERSEEYVILKLDYLEFILFKYL